MTSDRNSTAAPTKDPKTGTWRFVLDLGPGPDANGVWRQRRQAKRRGFPTKAAAMSAMTTLRTEGENGTYVVPRTETVATWMAVWFETLDAYVKPSTADFYRRVGKRYVVPKLGPIPLQALDAQHLNLVYAEMLRSGRKNGKGGLSVATVRHVHVIVGKALDAALRAGRIKTNPARSASPPTLRSAERPEMRTWSPAEVGRFLDFEAGSRYEAPFAFLAFTGCRRGEVLGLTWADVDLGGGQVSIRRTITVVDGAIHRSASTKTGKGRSIRLQPDLVSILKAWRKRQLVERVALGAEYEDEDLVFCQADGRPYHPNHFSREFDRRLKRHGMPVIRLHDLRHSYATMALAAGVPAKVVADRLGHGSVMITLDLYSHVMPAVEAEHADMVGSLIAGSRRRERASASTPD
jgi:integrase